MGPGGSASSRIPGRRGTGLPPHCGYHPKRTKNKSWLTMGKVTPHPLNTMERNARAGSPRGTSQALLSVVACASLLQKAEKARLLGLPQAVFSGRVRHVG